MMSSKKNSIWHLSSECDGNSCEEHVIHTFATCLYRRAPLAQICLCNPPLNDFGHGLKVQTQPFDRVCLEDRLDHCELIEFQMFELNRIWKCSPGQMANSRIGHAFHTNSVNPRARR